MRLLIVNDDGINAKGIKRLTNLVKSFGEVWVVAPDNQCSAMSHRITVFDELEVKPVEFVNDTIKAYSVSGTPADCVKVALKYLMTEKPDFVLSGINQGYNIGYDIAYSGTVGAALEARMEGIPAIAFSNANDSNYEAVDEYLVKIMLDVMKRECSENEIWNINFPGCQLSELKGIRETGNRIAQTHFYEDHYVLTKSEQGIVRLSLNGIPVTDPEEDTDFHAVLNNYISIGKVKSKVIQ